MQNLQLWYQIVILAITRHQDIDTNTDTLASNCLNAVAQNPRAMSYFIHRGAGIEKRRPLLKRLTVTWHKLPTYCGNRSRSSYFWSCGAACFAAPPGRPISGFVHGFEGRRKMDGNGSGELQFDLRSRLLT